MATRVRQSPGLALCQVGAHRASPTTLRWLGRPPQLRAGLHGATAVDRVWDGSPGVHLPTAGGRGCPPLSGGLRVSGLGIPHGKSGPTHRTQMAGEVCPSVARLAGCQGGHVRCRWAQFCPQGPAYMQSVMAAALGGSNNLHARWHAWKRGGSAALRWVGLPIKWLAWWGRWLSDTVAVHYADAPDDFVVTSEAILPWPTDSPTGEFEWRTVSLRDVFPRELLELCVPDADEPPGRGGDGDGSAGGRGRSCPGESAGSATGGTGGGEGRAGAQGRGGPPALTAIEGSAGRRRRPRGDGGGGGVIDVDADPPTRLCSRLLHQAAAHRGPQNG